MVDYKHGVGFDEPSGRIYHRSEANRHEAVDGQSVIEADEPIPAIEQEIPVTAAQQRRQEIAERRQAMLERQAETQVMCERHRKRLEQMEPARRVYYRDETGQEVRMDDVQRVSLIEESREYVTENCQ